MARQVLRRIACSPVGWGKLPVIVPEPVVPQQLNTVPHPSTTVPVPIIPSTALHPTIGGPTVPPLHPIVGGPTVPPLHPIVGGPTVPPLQPQLLQASPIPSEPGTADPAAVPPRPEQQLSAAPFLATLPSFKSSSGRVNSPASSRPPSPALFVPLGGGLSLRLSSAVGAGIGSRYPFHLVLEVGLNHSRSLPSTAVGGPSTAAGKEAGIGTRPVGYSPKALINTIG